MLTYKEEDPNRQKVTRRILTDVRQKVVLTFVLGLRNDIGIKK